MQARSEDSRAAIRRSALRMFCERGYCTATLEDIGGQVGVTRGTVLHHFQSKAALLAAVVAPYLEELDALLEDHQGTDLPTAAHRRRSLTALTDLFLRHRVAFRLLVTDVAARAQLGLVDQLVGPRGRLGSLLLGNPAGELDPVRVAAALGAILQPIACVDVELDTTSARFELVEAALAVLDRPITVSLPVMRDVPPSLHRAEAK